MSQQNPGISRQKSLISLDSTDIPNFLAPTPSRGRPPPQWKISGIKSLGLGSFFFPDIIFVLWNKLSEAHPFQWGVESSHRTWGAWAIVRDTAHCCWHALSKSLKSFSSRPFFVGPPPTSQNCSSERTLFGALWKISWGFFVKFPAITFPGNRRTKICKLFRQIPWKCKSCFSNRALVKTILRLWNAFNIVSLRPQNGSRLKPNY